MTPETYARVHALFMEAQALVPAELGPFLDRACADAPEIRREVQALLDQLDGDDVFDRGPPPDDPLRLVGEQLDGRYRVDGYVTAGGFSHVYRGWHLAWRMPVAIKLLKQTLTVAERGDLQDAFVREGALQVKLSRHSASVVQAYDLGTWTSPRGTPITYTVMEWLDGQPLSTMPGPWALADVLRTLGPIAEVLGIAHGAGIAHRDVKPDNVFVCEQGPAKLLDFGVAKLASHYSRGFDASADRASPFTPAYAAPEQASRQLGATGPHTDVYGLALLCAELLAGCRPYRSGTTADLLAQARDPRRRPTPRTLGADVSRPVERVFAKALALEPSARYPDVAAFWQALEEASAARSSWLPWRR